MHTTHTHTHPNAFYKFIICFLMPSAHSVIHLPIDKLIFGVRKNLIDQLDQLSHSTKRALQGKHEFKEPVAIYKNHLSLGSETCLKPSFSLIM